MHRIDYDRQQHHVYSDGRAHLPETQQRWVEFVRAVAPRAEKGTILDVGSGTGRFACLFASELGARVVGVEPSQKMREEATRRSMHPLVSYVRGTGERLPIEQREVDVVWVSMVLHHFSDLRAAAGEMHRVLKSDGVLLLRNSFGDRLWNIPLYEFFPGARRVDEKRLPPLSRTQRIFEAAGFRCSRVERVVQLIDQDLQAHAKRLGLRAISTFELMSAEEIDAGFSALQKACEDPRRTREPVTEEVDVAVFVKAKAG